MEKRKFLIDTDTASDDAVALIMAVRNPEIQVEGITVVAGNVNLNQAVQNAMYTLSLSEVSIPVYAGAEKPLIRDLKTADHVHGKDGMSDIGLPLHGFVPEKEHAVSTIIDTILKSPLEITLVCIGPLTNIAIALLLCPSLAKNVKECIIMGGVVNGRGNVTPVSEYNFWADPEAAKIVFESDMPIKMVGWDISRDYAVFDDVAVKRIQAINSPLASFSIDIQKTLLEYAHSTTSLKGFDLPDPIAMAIAIDESIATETKKGYVSILTNDDFSRGQSVVDFVGATGKKPNVEVVVKADSEKFKKKVFESLK